jgi:hypothetical protein
MAGERTAKSMRDNPTGESAGDVGVPLIRPEKVRGLAKWRQIIIVDEMANPIKARLVPYFKRRKWRAMTDKNPYRHKRVPAFDEPFDVPPEQEAWKSRDTQNDPNFDRPTEKTAKPENPKSEPPKQEAWESVNVPNNPSFDRPTEKTAMGQKSTAKPKPKAKPKPSPPAPNSPKIAKLKALADDPRTTKEERENARIKLALELKKKRGR